MSIPSTPADASDAELARRIQAASAGAAHAEEGELFRRFAPRVRMYGRRHLGPGGEDDLVQQTMETVIAKLRGGDVREPERIASFVLGCARLTANTLRRKARREQPVEAHAIEELGAPPALRPRPLAVERLAEAVAQLGERERTVVALSFYGEQSATEIAEAIGTSAGNVRVIRHRAVERLRGLMNVEEGAGD